MGNPGARMAMVKGTDFGSLRKLLRRRGSGAESAFVAALPGEQADMYRRVRDFDFIPVKDHARFIVAAAEILFPGQQNNQELLGRALAEVTFSGVYRIFLRIPSVSYIIGRAAAVWGTYYDTGEAAVENIKPAAADLVVRGFPELPAPLRRTTTGHVEVLLERTGAKDARIRREDKDPNAWRWITTWR